MATATDYGLETAATPDYGLESAAINQNNGATISPRTEQPSGAFEAAAWHEIPGAKQVSEAIDTLHDWADQTQEGKEQHPLQALIGQTAARLKQMLFGGTGGGLDMKTGFVNNPVTSLVAGAPSDAEINLARNVLTHPVDTARRAVDLFNDASSAARAARSTAAPVTENIVPNATVAQMRGAATTGGPATEGITNNDVLRYAADNGIRMTTAQRTLAESAKSEQALGEEAFGTGSMIKEAVNKEKAKIGDLTDALQDRIDPNRIGVSRQSAGENLQEAAEASRAALKKQVGNAYDQVDAQGVNLATNIQDPMNRFLYDIQNKVNPQLGISRPVTQTSGAKAAIEDIEKLMTDPGLQGDTPVDNLRNLRTTLLEKANDYGANRLSDSGQRVYKRAVGIVDDAIMQSAKGTDFEQSFRTAGAQNAKLQQLYNDPKSPLYRILNTDDPEKVIGKLLSSKSAYDINTLKSEGIDVGPIARQVVDDISSGGFKVTKTGLGGYPDSFLNSLLGSDATKELYTQGEIVRRLNESYNPSRSGRVILGAAQAVHPAIGSVFAQGARARSMPQDVAPFLPKSPITGGTLASPSELFKAANE